MSQLSSHLEAFIEIEIGKRLPYVGILLDHQRDEPHMAVFTNRKSDQEVIAMLEEALAAVRNPETPFKPA